MSTNFPTSLDTYTDVVDTVTDVLAAHVNDPHDAIEAIEAKVGINSSAVTTSHDYKIAQLEAGTGFTGSVTATRFIPTGSTVATNGLYLPAANTPALSANSTEMIRWTTSGVSIGGALAGGFTPKLQIREAGGVYLSTWNSSNSTEGLFGSGTADIFFGSGTNHPVNIRTNNIDRVNISTAGVFTIQTPSAGSALVANGVSGSPIIQVVGVAEGLRIQNTAAYVSFYNTAGSTRSGYLQLNDGSSSILSIEINQALLFATNAITRVTIPAAGGMAIAAPTSGVGLTVTGVSSGNALRITSSTEILRIETTTARGSGNNYVRFYDPTGATGYFGYAGSSSGLYWWNTLNHDAYFGTNDTLRLTLAANGEATFTKAAVTTPYDIGNSSTAFTVDFRNSNVQTLTMTGNVVSGGWTLSNPLNGQTVNIFITQDGTGSRTLGWPSSFKWPSGTAGTISTAAGTVDLLTLTYRSSTGFYYATLLKGFA